MVKKSGFLLVLVLFLVLFMISCAPKEEPAMEEETGTEFEPIELVAASLVPEGVPWDDRIVKPILDGIVEATNGRVTYVLHPGGSLLTSTEVYDGIVEGTADLGWCPPAAHEAGRFPITELFSLPGHPFTSSCSASAAIHEAIKILNPEEFQDIKILYAIATGPGVVLSTVPVKTLDDFKGLEIRVTSPQVEALKALGASPAVMPVSEAYEALDRGIVKADLGTIEMIKSWNKGDVTDYMTPTGMLFNSVLVYAMNLDTWNSFPKDIQEAIDKVAEDAFYNHYLGYYEEYGAEVMKEALETGAITDVFFLSEEDQKLMREKISFIIDDFAQELEEKGLQGLRAKELMFELAEKYNKQYKADEEYWKHFIK